MGYWVGNGNLELGIWNSEGALYNILILIILLINPRPNVPFGTGGCEICAKPIAVSILSTWQHQSVRNT